MIAMRNNNHCIYFLAYNIHIISAIKVYFNCIYSYVIYMRR